MMSIDNIDFMKIRNSIIEHGIYHNCKWTKEAYQDLKNMLTLLYCVL